MAFDPTQPYEVIDSGAAAPVDAPGFDPTQPYEIVAAEGFDPQAPFEVVGDPEKGPGFTLGAFGAEGALAKAAMGDEVQKRGDAVEFTGKDSPWRFTGAMVADPQTGVVSPVGGRVEFDVARLPEAVEGAWKAGLLTGEQYAEMQPAMESVRRKMEDEKALRAKAGENPELAALMQGLGRGGAMTLGGIGGFKAGAALGGAGGLALGGPPGGAIGAGVVGLAGAIGTSVAAGIGYDALYRTLAKHYEEYDSALAAAKLEPGWNAAGQLVTAAVALPASGVSAARGLKAAYDVGGAAQVARTAAQAAGAGAGTGVAGYALDATVRGEPLTAEGAATAAAGGALFGGLFINGKSIPTQRVVDVAAKVKAGTALTAEEEQIFAAARGPVQQAIAGVDAAGGVRPRIDVEIPQVSVGGLGQRMGPARVRTVYDVPERLPAGAVDRVRGLAARTEPAVQPVREAPVNVLPRGDGQIVTPPAGMVAPAMVRPDVYLTTMGRERGLDMSFNPEAETALLAEHFDFVRRAVEARQPVSSDALDAYEIRVPWYDRDVRTGLAVFDARAFVEHERMVADAQAADLAERGAGGVDILEAIVESGGLPAMSSPAVKQYAGELKNVREAARGGRDLGIKGVFTGNLFRKDAPDMDALIKGLHGYGFTELQTPDDVLAVVERRLATGQPIYGYEGAAVAEMYEGAELAGRRPAVTGAPRQMDLIGQDEGGFALVSDVDRTSLAPQELAAKAAEERRVAEAEKAQGDLFGMKQKAGAPAQVPPGQPAGGGVSPAPDWVLQGAETRDGRRLVKGIEGFKPGQKWGYRAIVDHVNRAVRMEMIRSKSQTTARNPAHYKPGHHVAMTRDTLSQINFHEAGHGLQQLIQSRDAGFLNAHAAELLALTKRPGSMASDPPAGASPAQQTLYRIGEGVAEWTRLLMMEPAAVQNLKVTQALLEAADKNYPGLAAALRDGARAVQRFQRAPLSDRVAMLNVDPMAHVGASDVMGALVRGREAFGNMVASGAPLDRLGRKLWRAIEKNRQQVGMDARQAVAKARAVRKETDAISRAYNMVLQIGGETQLAISGTGASKGLRAMGADGEFRYFTRWTWRDLRNRVPARHLALFDQAAWALESYERWRTGKLEYMGMREGITPDQLLAIVKQAQETIPGFGQMFAEQMNFHNAVLEMKEFGRLLKPGEREVIQNKRDTYWPMPRVVTAGGGMGGKTAGDIQRGLFRAYGSGEATRQIDEVTEERVQQALEAYYWNRLGLTIRDRMAKVAGDKGLPIEARSMAGSYMVPLKMPMAKVATLTGSEQGRIVDDVLKAVKEYIAEDIGFEPDITADMLNVSLSGRDIFRPTRPDDINVISLIEDGERKFYLLGDPAVFRLFAQNQQAGDIAKFFKWALGPATENWKRLRTQDGVFAVMNFFRDSITQMVLNPEPIGWIPAGGHILGAWNKFTKKYPQVFQEGLLLSRVQPTSNELVNAVKESPTWNWAQQGRYTSNAKDPGQRWLANKLNPSNWLMPVWKVGDVVNLTAPGVIVGGITGGLISGGLGVGIGAVIGSAVSVALGGSPKLAQYLEEIGREGAAVGVLRRGGTMEEAILKYWKASGQFNEHAGSADLRMVMSVVPFFNPMMQGVRNGVQVLSDPDPAVRGTAWARLMVMIPAMFGGGAALAWLMMSEKERDEERQRTLDDRMAYMNMRGMRVPFTYGPEGAMAALTYNAVMDGLLERKGADADQAAYMLSQRIFDPGGLLNPFGPQLGTLLEIKRNWSDWRQQSIVAPWMVNLPASEQYYSTTPAFYRKLGEMGDWSPAKLQYFVQQGLARQVDDVIRLVESMDGGRPMAEAADVPFVGRMFVRDPIGFSSQSVRDAAVVEDKLRLLNMRLAAKGWSQLRDTPDDALPTDGLRQLKMQLQYLELLKYGLRRGEDLQAMGKAAGLMKNWAMERNIRKLHTEWTQRVMVGAADQVEALDDVLRQVEELQAAPPEQIEADYLMRKF